MGETMEQKIEGIFVLLLLGAILLTRTFNIELLIVSVLLSLFIFLQFASD